MTLALNRRKALLERIDRVCATVTVLEELDSDTVLDNLPEALQSRFSRQRFRARFAMRHARRVAGRSLFAPDDDDRESFLMQRGALAVRALVARAGAHVLWRDVLHVVRRDELAELSEALGVLPRDAAANGRDQQIGVTPMPRGGEGLGLAIQSEGALCWACWLAARERDSAFCLRALTPKAVMQHVPRAAPEAADARARRRAVIDAELTAMMSEGAEDE